MNTFDQVKVVEWCWLMENVIDSYEIDEYWTKSYLNKCLSDFKDGTFLSNMTKTDQHMWSFVCDFHRRPLDRKMKSRRYDNILSRINGHKVIRTLNGGTK